VYSLSVDPLKYSEEDGDDDVAVGVEVGMGSVKDGMQGGVTEGDEGANEKESADGKKTGKGDLARMNSLVLSRKHNANQATKDFVASPVNQVGPERTRDMLCFANDGEAAEATGTGSPNTTFDGAAQQQRGVGQRDVYQEGGNTIQREGGRRGGLTMDVSRAGAQGSAPKGVGAAAGGRLAAFHSKGGGGVQTTPHVNSKAHGQDKENVAAFLSRMAMPKRREKRGRTPFMNTDRSNQGEKAGGVKVGAGIGSPLLTQLDTSGRR
jgi:hypothetical protein